MNSADTMKMMQRACVPQSCWSISTTKTGRMPLRDFANSVKASERTREQKASAYVYGTAFDSRVIEVEMLAKELVLAGVNTRYMTFVNLTRLVRMGRDEAEDGLGTLYGRGALVIPDVPMVKDIVESSQPAYEEAVDYLVNHVYEGGILVTSGRSRLGKGTTGWPPFLVRLLLESTQVFEGK